MAVICNTCGLPDDLCACGDLDKDSTHIIYVLKLDVLGKREP